MKSGRVIGEKEEGEEFDGLLVRNADSTAAEFSSVLPSPPPQELSLLGTPKHRPPCQTVALALLSEHLPAELISRQAARCLQAAVQAPVVLVRFALDQGCHATGNGPDAFLNGEFHMPAAIRLADGGFHQLTLGIAGQAPSEAGITSLLAMLSRQFRYVLIELASGEPAPWMLEFAARADLAYLFVTSKAEELRRLYAVARQLRPQSGRSLVVRQIACLAPGEKTSIFDSAPIDFFVHGCPTNAAAAEAPAIFNTDVRRIARQIGGQLVGLALSSGAAKGLAHIGVIQVLEENGIEVDVVAGSSMGAYVGSLWNFGCDGRELERLARELEQRWSMWSLIDPVFPPRQGFLRGFAVKKRIMRSMGDARFSDLVRPTRIMASNLATLERVAFRGGEVATAVHASIAVPGICVPVTINGEIYIDGGIVDPLPVDVLREMGVAKIIAVDAIPTSDRIRCALEAEREAARLNGPGKRKRWRKVSPLEKQLNYFASGNLFEILMRSLHGAQIRVAEAACRFADLVLRPDVGDDRWLDFRDPGRFIAPGRAIAERHLEAIRALAARKETTHECAGESLAATA